MAKIPNFTPIAVNHLRCKNCNHPHHHRHGFYIRKATHRSAKTIRVLRYRCLSCRRTFSLLPTDLLPVMRWRLSSVMRVQKILATGMSLWRAAQRLRVSLGVLLRLSRKLPQLSRLLQDLLRSKGVFNPLAYSFYVTMILSLWLRWHHFTAELSHVLYPLLHKALTIPHEM